MNVAEVMEKQVSTCSPQTDLETVAKTMWDGDCGAIPVVDEAGRPVGMVTDRDIAMGAALNHKPLWEMRTRDITNDREVFTCGARDDVHRALAIMKGKKVRRLPVVDAQGKLCGIISLDDLVIASGDMAVAGNAELSGAEVLHTLQRICSANLHYHAGMH